MGSFEQKMSRRIADKKMIAKDLKENKTMSEQENQPATPAPAAPTAVPKKPMNILERVAELETWRQQTDAALPAFAKTVDDAIGDDRRQLNDMREIINAMIEVVGAEAISKQIDAARRDRTNILLQKEKEGLEKLLADGRAVAVDVVEDGCFIIATELDDKGEPTHTPGYEVPTGHHQRFLNGFNPEVQEGIKGQKVGCVHTASNGFTLKIEGIYRFVQKEEPAAGGMEDLDKAVAESVTDDPSEAVAVEDFDAPAEG